MSAPRLELDVDGNRDAIEQQPQRVSARRHHRDGAARPGRVADEAAVELQQRRRIAVGQEEPRIDRGDGLVPRGRVEDGLGVHDLVVGERGAQIDLGRVEAEKLHGDGSGRIEQRGLVQLEVIDALCNADGFAEVDRALGAAEQDSAEDERGKRQGAAPGEHERMLTQILTCSRLRRFHTSADCADYAD